MKNKAVELIIVFSFLSCSNVLVNTNGEEMIQRMNNTIVVEFPLRGEWISPNTPGKKVPSHGTTLLGETYAYDFVRVGENEKTDKFYDTSVLNYLINGVSLKNCYGWGSEIYAPCDGEIVKVEDGVTERDKVNVFNDLRYVIYVTNKFKRGEASYKELVGNYIILKYSDGVYAVFAHLKMKSVVVTVGQKVVKGQKIGQVGHSGNSTAPHLHFQLMDNEDPGKANGIPCAFNEYEELRNKVWIKVSNGIPRDKRIRVIK